MVSVSVMVNLATEHSGMSGVCRLNVAKTRKDTRENQRKFRAGAFQSASLRKSSVFKCLRYWKRPSS